MSAPPAWGLSRHAAAAEAKRRWPAVLCLIASAPLAGAAAFDLQKVVAGVYKIYAWRFTAKNGMDSGTAFLDSGHRALITNHHVVDKGLHRLPQRVARQAGRDAPN